GPRAAPGAPTGRAGVGRMSMTATGGRLARRPCAAGMAGRRRLSAVGAAYKATRRGVFERFATSRQARISHEILVGVERFLALGRFYAIRGAVGQKFPALSIILEVRDHDLVEYLLVHGRVENRAEHLDAPVEVARHHIGGRDIYRRLRVRQAVTGAETIDAAMFQKPANDRFDADVVREARDARPQAGDAAHDKIDLHARARGRVEHVDDLRVHERIVLHPDRRGLAGLGVRDLLADVLA